MKCSFIVSAYDRPDALACLLWSLKVQTEPGFDVIVVDNGDREWGNLERLNDMYDHRFQYIAARKSNCYESSNLGAKHAMGEYLCFPSDDGYYVPRFLELMLEPKADLTYCDMLYDPRLTGVYAPIRVEPGLDIDKGGFLVKRECFQPFPWERPDGLRMADHFLIDDLIAAGVRHAKVPGVLFIHN
jgi:glycosyltransferase involved in cell wall biosynthesis